MSISVHVVGFSGSLRKSSYNSGLLRAAQETLPEGMTLEVLDLSGLPFFNQDVEAAGVPEAVRIFKERIKAADALLIATPEYNYSIPGVLKNALDWASRPMRDSALNDKPVAIMGAGGMMGSGRAQYHLRQIGVGTNMHILNRPEVLVPRAMEKFDAEGHLKDETVRQQVKDLLLALGTWTRRLRGG
jgi:chromate reductase